MLSNSFSFGAIGQLQAGVSKEELLACARGLSKVFPAIREWQLDRTQTIRGNYNEDRSWGQYVVDLGDFEGLAHFMEALPPGSVFLDNGAGTARAMTNYFDLKSSLYWVKQSLDINDKVFTHNHDLFGVAISIRDPGQLSPNTLYYVDLGKMIYVVADVVEFAKTHRNTFMLILDDVGGLTNVALDEMLYSVAIMLKPGGRNYFSRIDIDEEFLREYLSRSRGLRWVQDNPVKNEYPNYQRQIFRRGHFERTDEEPYFPKLVVKKKEDHSTGYVYKDAPALQESHPTDFLL